MGFIFYVLIESTRLLLNSFGQGGLIVNVTGSQLSRDEPVSTGRRQISRSLKTFDSLMGQLDENLSVARDDNTI